MLTLFLEKRMRWIFFLVAATIGLTLDLGTKEWAFSQKELHSSWAAAYPVIPDWFDIQLSENAGAAWGLFSGKHTFFMVISIVAFIAIVYFVHTANEKARAAPTVLGLIFAGVLGNFWDRTVFGVVRDFLAVHTPETGTVHDFFEKTLGHTHWPTFNVADMCITCGAVCLVVIFWRDDRGEKASPAAPAAGPAAAPPPGEAAQPVGAPVGAEAPAPASIPAPSPLEGGAPGPSSQPGTP